MWTGAVDRRTRSYARSKILLAESGQTGGVLGVCADAGRRSEHPRVWAERLDAASGEIERDPAFDLAGLEVGKDLIDVSKVRLVNMGADLVLVGELDGFVEVLARADDRAADRDSLQNDIENRCPLRLAA